MKDKRNCGTPYPIYPPVMGLPAMPTPYMSGYNQGYSNNSLSSNTIEQQINNLEQQINNLESRLSKIENTLSNNNSNNSQYNGSNYYMV